MLPPVLEIYVLYHSDDNHGREFAAEVFAHFHGTPFSGLIGGAIEVFVRSSRWQIETEAPRPITFPDQSGPNGIRSPQILALVPVLSVTLARSVEQREAWGDYLRKLVQVQSTVPHRIGIFPISVESGATDGTELGALFGAYQRIGVPSGLSTPEPLAELRCRDLAQGITQMISGPDSRLQIFVSHTRRFAAGEENVPSLIGLVREIIAETRLRHFFDANDLQPGRDWEETLRNNAAQSALLALRTDLYASRTWCQREMLLAKNAGMPIVILDSLGRGEERGSFLMDHLPRIPVRETEGQWNKSDIRRGINVLVDECLKRAVWRIQKSLAADQPGLGVAWWAPHAPEPTTLAHWLLDSSSHPDFALGEADLRIIHPDPPLGPDERQVLMDMLRLMGFRGTLEVTTPRGLAARGA